MKPILATAFALALGLLSACSSAPTSGSNSGNTASSGSGVTVFGTIDAGVSGYSTRSERR